MTEGITSPSGCCEIDDREREMISGVIVQCQISTLQFVYRCVLYVAQCRVLGPFDVTSDNLGILLEEAGVITSLHSFLLFAFACNET